MKQGLATVLICIFVLGLSFGTALAQTRVYGQQSCPTYSDTAPRTLPLVSEADLVGEASYPIPVATMSKVYDRCLSRPPKRFTPDAHDSYCTCAAAALHGSLTLGELTELQKEKNRRIGNPAYEKFVTLVVSPCMVEPIEEIEYLYCMVDKANDIRIRHFPTYCSCVGKEMRKHLQDSGDVEAMLELGNKSGKRERDPTDAFLSGFTLGKNAGKN
jgi:hypothetical protein